MKVNSIFGILSLIITPLLAGKEHIMMANVNSWISTENFTTIIKKTFLYSQCCNIYLSDLVRDVEILFNQFIAIYPHEYLLRKKIYDCQGYFLLGPTDKEIKNAMQKVPSSISTTEILIIINGELKNNSELFNVSLYGNSNTNIISRSSIYTLSENYLEPRFFLKVNSYEELMSEFNIINMRGRELQVSSFHQPPVSYLKTTIKKVINDLEKDGIEMKIFLLLAEKLNFTWTIRKPPGRYRYGRRVNDTYWNGGVIQLLREQKIHLTFGNIWLTQDTNEFVNMTQPWYQIFIHFLVPRPRAITNFWALTKPFSMSCWLLLLTMLFVKTIYMWTRARIDPRFPKRFRNFFFTITELMGRLLGTWVPRNIANARFELLLWQSVGVVLVTAYGSSLAVRLASWEYENRIDTVRQFIEANLSWGRKGAIPPFKDYFDLENPYSGQLPSKYIPVNNDEDTHRFIKRRKYAIIGQIIGSIFFPDNDILKEDLKEYRVMRELVGNYYTSFGVQPWLLRPVNTIILWLKESGIAHFHLADVIRRRASTNLRELMKEYDHDGSAKTLTLTPLGAGFTALIVGLLISTIVFFYELKQAAGSRSIREVFRKIQEKRRVCKLSPSRRKSWKENELMKHNLNKEDCDLFVIKSTRRSTSTEFSRKSENKILSSDYN
ncbi:uncharacterized protein [Linepithema humile]|uniref:uncharacterized protein isoform X2 n=1 Tax=Linepithema humile TaxID=83485 RepID=UPI00351EE22F